ncbi:MAG: GNAT family N-acetyltransferase [Phycisphaerae bacterium]|nr:GNAT family N-acetyltransferase [Phycisphaerae bacterium]
MHNRNYIFVHEESEADTLSMPEELRFARYATPESIPPEQLYALKEAQGDVHVQEHLRWMRQGAVLWVAVLDGKIAGSQLCCLGRHLRRWFVPLQDHDLIIFRVNTVSEFRGRGISPLMMRHIITHEAKGGARTYADCKVYNRPSIRSIEKAGFRRIATARPLSREEVVK